MYFNWKIGYMKKIIVSLAVCCVIATGCYDDYTMDYEYTGIYSAYQYDLRTFVVGEGMKFDFTVALGGVVENVRDRTVEVTTDDALLSADLSTFSESEGTPSFTALDGLKGMGRLGALSQSYVSDAFADVKEIVPLPSSCYELTGLDGLTICKGRHTASVTVHATDEILSDPKAFGPCYALGFRIVNADADVLVKEKSFEVIAVKCENRFYGNWYHGGRTVVRSDATGEILSTDEYELTLPQADSKVYRLTTVDAVSVRTDRMGGRTGSLLLTFEGNDITISPADGSDIIINPIQGYPSRFNGADLLQNRELSLNYCYSNGDGTTTYVYDVLKFRNRIRDGINEWQSE